MIFDEGQEQEGILLEQKCLQVRATWVGVSARSEPSQKAEERGRHLISEGPVEREPQGDRMVLEAASPEPWPVVEAGVGGI